MQMVMAAAEQAFVGQRDLGGQLARAEFLRQVEQGKVMGERMFQEMVEVARGEGDKEFKRRVKEGRLEGEEEFKKQVAHSYAIFLYWLIVGPIGYRPIPGIFLLLLLLLGR